ncbi:MAG TPA: ROK family protein [Solirubrobacteraceae bacterium]|jgi:glucokinase|nr:ROK family protein [Solirubrobacteraceae bacterium]
MPARRVIGVDLGGTKILAGAVDPRLGVHHRVQRAVTGLQQSALLDLAVEVVAEARESAGAEIAAVGFGLPALIDRRTGRVAVGVHTPLIDLPFADIMAERLGLPVFVDNDGNNSALAEHRAGAARGASDAVVLTLGTGIAGGLILDGRLYRGSRGGAGELGHMEIDFDGERDIDNCPGRGCAEMFVSGRALVKEATRLAGQRPSSALARAVADGQTLAGPLITELAHDGDPAAIEAVELIGTHLGVVITSLVNIFNPQVVVIGGGVIAAGELLLAPAREVARERTFPFFSDDLRIVMARFGVEAGMIGAAALAYDGLATLEEATA